MTPELVLIHTVRADDPDGFYYVVTRSLADLLTPGEPWRDLLRLEALNDRRLRAAYVTRTKALAVAKGCRIVDIIKTTRS